VIGGLAVGVFETFVATYQGTYAPWLGSNFSLVSPYLLMLLVLFVRPYGLFGTPEVRAYDHHVRTASHRVGATPPTPRPPKPRRLRGRPELYTSYGGDMALLNTPAKRWA
jgi:hypothetical protein